MSTTDFRDAASGIAIVTGAGSGIGQAIALRLARDGRAVLLVDRNPEGLEATRAAAPNASVATFEADVTASDAPAAIFEACRVAFGDPSILINNAGKGNARSAAQTSDEEFDLYIDVNLRSTFRLSRTFVAARPQGGVIVNISSIFGQVGFPGTAPYSVAKAGIIGLTMQMAADYASAGHRINAIAPGLIATPATADRMARNERYRTLTLGQIPFGRAGLPEDIAGTAAFLCSEDARYICGQVIVVDGGWTATRYTSLP